jgi:DNA-directed RNA polymerase subunit RPC12/RpoP
MTRINHEGFRRQHLPTIICPFCDSRIKQGMTPESVVKCRNCGEAFEPEPDSQYEESSEREFF